MRVATMISLGASALLGVGALFVARQYLPSADGPSAEAPRVAADTPVVVASMALPYGTKLEAKHLAVVRVPANVVPEGAFASVQQVLEHDQGTPVVLTPLTVREPLLPSKMSGPGARASVASMISPGQRAYTIRVSDVAGVGGHVLPGDRVDVLLTRDVNADDEIEQLVSDVVIQNVRMLGLNLNADPTSSKTDSNPETATLEVSVEDAQKLSVAADLGALSLMLRRSGASETAAIRPIGGRDLGVVGSTLAARSGPPAQAPAAAVPPAPPPPPARVKAAPAPRSKPRAVRQAFIRPSASIVVVHGEEVAEVVVASEWGGGV